MNNSENWLGSIYSDGSKYFVSNPCPKKGEKIKIALQIAANAPAENVFFAGKRNGVGFPVKMRKTSEKNGLSLYQAEVTIWENEFSYYFIISTKNSIYYYNQE